MNRKLIKKSDIAFEFAQATKRKAIEVIEFYCMSKANLKFKIRTMKPFMRLKTNLLIGLKLNLLAQALPPSFTTNFYIAILEIAW